MIGEGETPPLSVPREALVVLHPDDPEPGDADGHDE